MKNLILTMTILAIVFGCQHSHEHTHEDQPKEKAELYDYDVEARITDMGITLSEPPAPVANYVNAVRTGNLVFMAGKGPNLPEGGYVTGKLGETLTVEEGYEAAKLVAQAQLSALKAEIGDLNKVVRIVKVLGMVNCAPDFANQPEVINGFSDTMVEVFGDRGKHARAAVGMASLPRNIAVEIEMIVEVQD
ncbi:RidA family protein [Ekhidna sp.]|uniref:RidA family protein n=1 Tax=Ekhidna sp. TaxID=2608089 RepID=UPI0032ED87AF